MKRLHSRNFSLLLTLLVMFAALFMTSCDDDDDYYSPLEGSWYIVEPPTADYNEYDFYSNGTGNYYVEDYAGNSNYYFTWETFGSDLYIYFAQGDTWRFSWLIRDGYLYLYPYGGGLPLVYAPF